MPDIIERLVDTPPSASRAERRAADLEHIQEFDVYERDAVGYTNSVLLQATFPYRNPNETTYVARNGSLEVTMTSAKGLPYGIYPRLIMCWITMAVQQNAHIYEADDPERYKIVFGNNLAAFMRSLGIETASYDAKRGNAARLREQLLRLFRTAMTIEYRDEGHGVDSDEGSATIVGDTWKLYWGKNDTLAGPEQPQLFQSHVVLSRKFFDMLASGAVPIDMDILRHIQQSPMAIDLYLWLTHRYSRLRAPTVVTLPQLMLQFGTRMDPEIAADRRDFKAKLKKAIAKVHEAWPEARISLQPGSQGVLLRPTAPSVPVRKKMSIKKPA